MRPRPKHAATLVRPNGTLLVIAAAGEVEGPSGPAFPLTRREIAAFADDGLDLDVLEDLIDDSGTRRWLASFVRARR